MSESSVPASRVSRTRKMISGLLLVILLIVLAIELRAAVGHTWTGIALEENSDEGLFVNTPYSEVRQHLKFWPSEEILREENGRTEYRYSWFSLLRPLISENDANYYVISTTIGDSEGAVYDVALPNPGEVSKLARLLGAPGGDFGGEVPDGFGGPAGPGDFGGGGGFGGRDRGPAPAGDRLLTALDSDSDGELSENELAAAVDVLLALDGDSDGKLSPGEMLAESQGPPQRRRPPMEEDSEKTPDSEVSESE